MARWVTAAEVKAIVGINVSHTDDIYFQQYIDRAQLIDVKPLLGDRLYASIDADQDATDKGNYPELLDGANYEDGGYSYVNEGLKKVVAYFAVAHYRFDGKEIDTPYGFAEVEAANIQKSSRERDREMMIYYRNLAETCWKSVRDYLQRNADTFTLWYSDQAPEWDKTPMNNVIQPVTLM